jgi:hypothetical protein
MAFDALKFFSLVNAYFQREFLLVSPRCCQFVGSTSNQAFRLLSLLPSLTRGGKGCRVGEAGPSQEESRRLFGPRAALRRQFPGLFCLFDLPLNGLHSWTDICVGDGCGHAVPFTAVFGKAVQHGSPRHLQGIDCG